MYLDESYMMYKLANHLTVMDGFELIHMNENEEIWLEKREGKTSHVIRLFHAGFDWKNHLKKDIARVFQKSKAIKRYLQGKHIEIHNVYIAEHAPVDDWEILKKPMQLNEKNPIKMNVYYLSENEKEEELARLQEAVGSTFQRPETQLPEADQEADVNNFRKKLAGQIKQKEKETKDIFAYGKPFLTYILLAVNVLIYLLLELNGNSTSTETLIKFGAKYNPAIIENGEWWRVVTSMFLHIGLLHLFMNMLAVYYLGTIVERIYGSLRFLLIYFLAGIGGGLASFAFTTSVSAGASGALFGLFGALLFFGCIHKRIFFQTMGMNLLIIIGINIVFGLSVPQVDNGAHMGGLVAGFIASAVLYLPKKKNGIIQLSAFVLYLLITFGLVIYGVDYNRNSPAYQLMKAEQLIAEKQYEDVVDTATKGLSSTQIEDELESHLLFQRSYAYIQMNRIDQAITDLQKSVKLNDAFAEAHYNLAILYGNNSAEEDKALEHIKRAYDLDPENEDIATLYEQLIRSQGK
ncbi:rhomboid family intramembrane serine protease [Lentibacillus salicampi]|uniref:Rhomboid family intramembrane serine protease n=1 Tax=Lentibacillus salicampi TaxID=175306 RepID=A0A4Y9ACR8_9BACI|nr:rhomboid family intramembrane serine protease [Lentibacillus salicampi]TFJ93669.1 rhomboid family intramembrane serine protease [Lentibacillus salicampi]